MPGCGQTIRLPSFRAWLRGCGSLRPRRGCREARRGRARAAHRANRPGLPIVSYGAGKPGRRSPATRAGAQRPLLRSAVPLQVGSPEGSVFTAVAQHLGPAEQVVRASAPAAAAERFALVDPEGVRTRVTERAESGVVWRCGQ